MKKRKETSADPFADQPIILGTDNVFADLGYEDAGERRLRVEVARLFAARFRSLNVTQSEAARRLKVPQPQVSAILGLKLRGFSIERLAVLVARLGADIEITYRERADGSSGTVSVNTSKAAQATATSIPPMRVLYAQIEPHNEDSPFPFWAVNSGAKSSNPRWGQHDYA